MFCIADLFSCPLIPLKHKLEIWSMGSFTAVWKVHYGGEIILIIRDKEKWRDRSSVKRLTLYLQVVWRISIQHVCSQSMFIYLYESIIMSILVVFQSNRSDIRRKIQWNHWVFLSPRMAYTPEETILEDVSDDARMYECAYK